MNAWVGGGCAEDCLLRPWPPLDLVSLLGQWLQGEQESSRKESKRITVRTALLYSCTEEGLLHLPSARSPNSPRMQSEHLPGPRSSMLLRDTHYKDSELQPRAPVAPPRALSRPAASAESQGRFLRDERNRPSGLNLPHEAPVVSGCLPWR